jgi:hypothetical protein
MTANKNFTTTLRVNRSPEDVFKTIMNVQSWWSGLYGEQFEGSFNQVNDEFTFTAGNGMHYSKQQLTELIPNKMVSWLVTDSKLDFLKDKNEWTNTRICFELTEQDGQTLVLFTHIGLVPEVECYTSCAPAWTRYIHEQLLKVLDSSIALEV